MKAQLYNIWFLLLFPTLLMSYTNSGELTGKHTKEKTIQKEFKVNKDAILEIDNDYGNLDITSWNEDRIVIDVVIKVSGNDEEKVLKKLESIDIEFTASPQSVHAKTIFGTNSMSWWDKLTSGWNHSLNMKIDYAIKVPITNHINLDNDYGSITIDKTQGNTEINCDYGQIIIGELLSDQNYIHIDYTNNSSIAYLKSGKINADYSDFEIENSDHVDLKADYTQSHFGTIKYLKYNCDYGGIKVENVNTIIGNSDYVETKIGNVSKELTIDSDYGSIVIQGIRPSFDSIDMKTDYTGVSIGYEPKCTFNFSVVSSYGGIKLDESMMVNKKYTRDSKKDYQGFYGNPDSESSINISAQYGGIKIRKN